MGLFKSERVIKQQGWIFAGDAGKRDVLENSILQTLAKNKYPFQTKIQMVKSGGLIFGSKDQCVTIETASKKRIIISNTSVGTYLYVGIYLMCPVSNANNASLDYMNVSDIFQMQEVDAAYNAAMESILEAFKVLGLKQQNYGFQAVNG